MLQSGQLLDGRYEILEKLGEGAFGETYRASDQKRPSNPVCVVKRLKAEHTHPIVQNLFEREAIVLEKLGEHPQIPRLLAHFMTNDGLFIVQEFVEGHPLNLEIKPGKPLSESYVIKLLQDILEILVFVHEKSVIHRDIKPANVMRRKDGKLVLIDFGVVKELGSIAIDPNGVAKTSIAAGTQGYMPFEQFKGKPGLYSDVYAVGMMAIEALTGIPPYHLLEDSETGEVIWRDQIQISDRLTAFLEKMVRDRYAQRYASGIEALQALQQVTSSSASSSPSPSPSLPISPLLSTIISPPTGGALQAFEFETVTVNGRGEITNRHNAQAEYFVEDLGNGITLEMAKILGGKFLMGSPESELQRYSYESPQHQVMVPEFFIGKFPVTQAQYRAIVGSNPSKFKGEKRPVEQVSWHDAVAFCQRLSQRTGRTYRLPSEAEWEYACRAGTTTPFHFGETITTDLANYDANYIYASAPKGRRRKQTTDVGSFPPNAFGLYDMHGNVWEWCQDTWHENYNGAPIDGSAWTTRGKVNGRRLRGGSWNHDPNHCRSAFRHWLSSNYLNCFYGFRVVLVARIP